MAAPIIGIDLGTTNSCAAVVGEAGEVKLIPYKGGDFIVPSVVAVDGRGRELIGQEAKRQAQLNPLNTIYASKRLIGRPYRSEVVEKMRRLVPYGLAEDAHGGVVLKVGKSTRTLSEIAARVLAKIRDVAQEHLHQAIDRAVVTVPAYFTDRQRQAVKEAGRIIGLSIVRIINEPTSAALAYGAGKKLHERVVIYDLGGGTFDVSVIEIRDRIFEVRATGGDMFLGGIDFDDAIIRHVLDGFRRKHGIDLTTDPVAMQRMKDLAERTKIDLSARREAPFHVPFVAMSPQGQPLNIETAFDRALLERLTSPLVDRTIAIVEDVLAASELTAVDIDEVLLVGGQSRMPLVQEKIAKLFGKPPSKGVHPDEAVAIGAALYAHSLEENSPLRLQLLDVIPMAIGLERADGSFHVVFPRNAPIPNAKVVQATTSYAGQTELAVRIWQGDHARAGENELLGDFLFSGLRKGRKGEAQVEIIFDVNVEGILTMRAQDQATGKAIKTTIRVTQS